MHSNESPTEPPPRRIRVNGKPVPPEAVEFEFLRLTRFYREHLPEERIEEQLPLLRRRAVDQAIGARLLMDEAQRLDLRVSEAQVDERVARAEREAGGPDAFQRILVRQKLTPGEFREQMRRARRIDSLVDQAVAQAPDPTENDVRAHFEANRAQYARAARMRVRHILVKHGADENHPDRAAAHQALETARTRILDGADFADVAAGLSDCPSGRKTGGSLGWISRGMLTPAFEQALERLQVGDAGEIVETELGLHLVFKDAEAPAEPADFETARESIRDFLRHAARGAALSAFIDELRAKARIEGV